MTDSPQEPAPQSTRKAKILAVSAVACMLLVYATPMRHWLHIDRAASLTDWARDLGPFGPLIFGCLTFVGVSIGAPRLLFAGAGGYLFGFWQGLLAAQLGTLAGSVVTFVYGRHLGREYVAAKIGSRFEKLRTILDQVGKHGILTNLLIRNIPVGNSFMMTLAMSVSPMPLLDFTIGTFLGTLPEAALCAYFLDSHATGLATRVGVCSVIVIGLALVSWIGLRKSTLVKQLKAANTTPPAAAEAAPPTTPDESPAPWPNP